MEGVPVLLYHDISNRHSDTYTISPSLFSAHLEWLYVSGYRAISFEEIEENHDGKRVILTFDDGYESFLEYAFPLLREYGFKATVNVIGEHVGRFIDYGGNRPTMSWDDYRYLLEVGLVEVGCHTFSLHRWKKGAGEVSGRYLLDDLDRFQKILREETGEDTKILSWPYGIYGKRTMEIAIRAGFTHLLTSKRGYYTPGRDGSIIPRFNMNESISLASLRKLLEEN